MNTLRLNCIAMTLGLTIGGMEALAADSPEAIGRQPGFVESGYIVEEPSFASSHASTVEETPEGLVASWFGGPYERHPEVVIWVSRHDGRRWLDPVQVADGIQADGAVRYPCWNPVLYQVPDGPLILFYKVGPSPSEWWGMQMTSTDGGRTWSKPVRLPDGQVGPVRNKPISLPDGSLLCGSSTEDQGWRIHMERTPDQGRTWERTPALNDAAESGLIQPTLLRWPNGGLQILCRSRQGRIYESRMGTDWKQWSPPEPIQIPNPNSAIDAVMLRDGRALLVYNHTARGRSPINVAVSSDGKTWHAALVLETEPGEFSYPAVIQSRDGRVHITYTWNRKRIKHVIVDPARLETRSLTDADGPAR